MKIDSSWYLKPPGIPESPTAGGIIVRWEEGLLWVALVREGNLPDTILPKGRIEPGETPQVAAQREIAEEAGLQNLTFLGELGVQERLDFRKRSWKITHYFLYYAGEKEGLPTDRRHAYRVEWFPIDSLPSMFWPEQKALIEQNREKILGLTQDFSR